MVYVPSDGTQQKEHRIVGILLALSSGIGVAAHLILMRKLSQRGDDKRGYGTLDLLARSYSYARYSASFGRIY